MSDMEFNKTEVERILSQIEEKNNNIKAILEDVELMSSAFDGEDDTWKGKGQESFYNSYKTIAKKFPTIEEKLDDIVKFLEDTINNYVEEDTVIDNAIDKS